MKSENAVSVWFFTGALLAFYGVVILGYGLFTFNDPQKAIRVLSEYHPDVWWGGLLSIVGAGYTIKFFPRD